MKPKQSSRLPLFRTLLLALLLVSACAPEQTSLPASTPVLVSQPVVTPTSAQEGSTGERTPIRLQTDAAATSTVSNLKEKLILQVDDSIPMENIYPQLILSPDGQHVAYVLQQENSFVLTVDGKQWQPVDGGHTPVFNSDGSQVAFAASIDQKWHMIVNDEAGPAYDSMGYPVFSPDGTRLAYSVEKDGKWYMVVDGVMSAAYNNLGSGSLALGSDSFKPNFYGIPPVFSPDSQRVAYVARNGQQEFVVMDGKAGKPYDEVVGNWDVNDAFELIVTQSPIVFSPDSQHFAYVARQQGALYVVVDGEARLLPYDQIRLNSLSFSPDGSRFGYVAGQNDKFFVVIDGKSEDRFMSIVSFAFSPDSQHVAYSAERDAKWYVVVDGQESAAYDVVVGASFDEGSAPLFSPDSQRVAYAAARDGKIFAVVDGQDGEPYEDAGLPRFSPDSTRVAFTVAKEDHQFALIDGALGDPYIGIGPAVLTSSGYRTGSPLFSGDSQHVAYTVKKGDQWVVVLDGRETEAYDLVFGMAFSDSATIHYLAQKDHSIFLVTKSVE